MEDKVFGNLTFNHGWIKKEAISLWGKNYNLDIRTSSYLNQEPNEKQREAYKCFKSSISAIDEETQVKLAQFISDDPDSEISGSLEWVMNEFPEHVQPEEILFFQDGSYAIECCTDWNEDGISILINNKEVMIGYSDELLDRKI